MTSIPSTFVDEHTPTDIVLVHDTAGTVRIIHVFDEIDVANAHSFSQEIETEDDKTPLVIDLSKCNYVDFGALAVVVKAWERWGERLRIVVPPSMGVECALRAAKLDRVLPIAQSLESALHELTRQTLPTPSVYV